MKYKHGRPTERQYDSCYYEIGAVELSEDEVNNIKKGVLGVGIQLTVTKASKMNVFLYGGNSRHNATESVVPGNGQVELNKPYFVDYQKGMLLVAYPSEENLDTEFEFKYELKGYTKSDLLNGQEVRESNWWDFEGPDGEFLLLIISAVVGFLVIGCLAVCIGYYCCCRKGGNRVEIIDEKDGLESGQNLGTHSPRAPAGNDTSVQLEDMDEEDYNVGQDKKNVNLIKGEDTQMHQDT